MKSILNVVRIAGTLVLGLGVLSACADRLTSMRARRVGCVEYNDYAKKNNMPLLCQAGVADKVEKEPKSKIPVAEFEQLPEELKNADGNATFNAGEAPVAGNEKAEPKVLIEGLEQNISGAYTRTAWMERFNALIVEKSAAATALVKEITITSSIPENQTVMDVQALVLVNGTPMYLETAPNAQVVRYDAETVMPMGIQVRAKLGEKTEAIADEVILSATCLKDESPCQEFGVTIDFANNYKMDAKNSRILAVFKVKAGSVVESNLTAIKEFVRPAPVAEQKPEEQKPEEQKQPTKADLLKGVQNAASAVARSADAAEDAYVATKKAREAGDAAGVQREAAKAEKAAMDAEQGQAIVADWTARLLEGETDSNRLVAIDAMVKESSKRVAEAKKFAADAKEEAAAQAASVATETSQKDPLEEQSGPL